MTGVALTFNAERHEYRTPDGAIVPSVTQILSAVGVATDFDEIASISAKRAAAIERKRAIGHAVHADAHAYDDDDLIFDGVDPDVRPYLDAWITFRGMQRLTPVTRERILYHPIWRYSGTLDGIFLSPEGERILIDIKVGNPEDAGAQFQTAGYTAAWEHEHPDDLIHQRWAVRLCPGETVPYRIFHYRDWQHVQKFFAFVTTFYEQSVRRGKPHHG
jgi:hypothetical protein